MGKYFLLFFFTLLSFFSSPLQAYAIENPLSVPNNKIGVHTLFDWELQSAGMLVNANGGDWGYVTIPIQAGDKDIVKWQKFMNEAKRLHVIPILRLATNADPFNTQVWREANNFDIIDFANFLNSLDWPVKNRYIIVFNEVNRADEWGGEVNPAQYAQLLSLAVTVFKSTNPDFFIINAGLDNAAPNQGTSYMNQYEYMRQMNAAVPNIFSQIDGLSSHSYPNPGFAQKPNKTSPMGTGSFIYERELTKSLSNKDLPVFITETGWSLKEVSEDVQASYYKETLETIWNDSGIVAVTPFVLSASGPFEKFSLIGQNSYLTKSYLFFKNLPKTKGVPILPPRVLAAETNKTDNASNLPARRFTEKKQPYPDVPADDIILYTYKWLMHL